MGLIARPTWCRFVAVSGWAAASVACGVTFGWQPEPSAPSNPAAPSAPARPPTAGSPAPGGTIEASSPEEARAILKAQLTAELSRRAEAKDLPGAAKVLEDLVKLSPGQWQPRYNLAAVRARMGSEQRDAAAAALADAFSCGLDDFARIRADGALAGLLDHPVIEPIAGAPEKLLLAIRDSRAAAAKKQYGNRYSVTNNDALRAMIVSSVPESSTAFATEQMVLIRDWWQHAVLPEGTAAIAQGGPAPSPWVMVVIPTRPHFNRWAAEVVGARADSLAGLYDHDRRELVTQDTGSTLRHEFAHALHWRHMMRLGQFHPVWVQEGLCALVEDVTMPPAGKPGAGEPGGARDGAPAAVPVLLTPVPSWRTNTVRRMAELNNLPRFAELFAMQPEKFTAERTLANYAAARAIFLYLSQKGLLRAWYGAFTEGFAADPTGGAALSAVLGKPLGEVEKDFRSWARGLPDAPDANRGNQFSFGTPLEQAADGLAVTQLGLSDLRTGGLLPGDVVQVVAGTAVRDWHDLERALKNNKFGDVVEVQVRRQQKVVTLKLQIK